MPVFGGGNQFGNGSQFGGGIIDPDCLAIAESIFSRLHSPLNITRDKDSPQYHLVLALAQAICTMKDEAIATHNDNFLSLGRAEHIQDVWGDLLKFPYDSSKTIGENIQFYQGLIKILLAGTEFVNLTYPGTHAVNIVAAIYLFTLITGVRIYEFWRDLGFMFGNSDELFEIGPMDVTTESVFGGPALIGPGDSIINRLALIQAGAQLVVPLDNYPGVNTDPIVEAKELIRPVMSDFVIVYQLQNLFPGGVDPDAVSIAFGSGTQPLLPLPVALAAEVYRTAVFQTYTDLEWIPTSTPTTRKRYFGVIDREAISGNVPITEVALLDAAGNILMYRTFSVINKTDDLDVLFSMLVDFT